MGPSQNIQKVLDEQKVLSVRILNCFSALRNAKYLIATESSTDDIQCLHGIRVLSLFFVTMAHMIGEIFIRDRLYNNDSQVHVNILHIFFLLYARSHVFKCFYLIFSSKNH